MRLRRALGGGNEVVSRCNRDRWTRFISCSGYHRERLAVLASRCDSLLMAVLATMLVISVAINLLLVVAACNDRHWSWTSGYLLSASVSVGLLTGGAVLMLP